LFEVSSDELAFGGFYNSEGFDARLRCVVLQVSWGRCIFRYVPGAYLIVLQSKNKALDHSLTRGVGFVPEWSLKRRKAVRESPIRCFAKLNKEKILLFWRFPITGERREIFGLTMLCLA
jgi:hypothetical protein